MTERRNKIEIISDILHVIYENNGKIKPTKILYKSNLSHTKMKTYLQELKEKNLINETEKENTKYYSITNGGIKFLEEYGRITEFMKSFGL